jgi:hypothetical protein
MKRFFYFRIPCFKNIFPTKTIDPGIITIPGFFCSGLKAETGRVTCYPDIPS